MERESAMSPQLTVSLECNMFCFVGSSRNLCYDMFVPSETNLRYGFYDMYVCYDMVFQQF
jgi:hypothetical protein